MELKLVEIAPEKDGYRMILRTERDKESAWSEWVEVQFTVRVGTHRSRQRRDRHKTIEELTSQSMEMALTFCSELSTGSEALKRKGIADGNREGQD